MTENIKQFLHTWCSQSKKLPPAYNIKNQGGRGNQRLRFNCEVTVDGFNYTGYGSSTNKKDAQTNAARDFVNFLVRENFIQKNIVPEFKHTELIGQSEIVKEQIPIPKMSAQLSNLSQNDIRKTYFNNILDQKRLEEAEDVDFTADIHGHWSLDNAKGRLNQYMQQSKIHSEYKFTSIGPDHNKSFVCEMTIVCKQLQKNLYARETGSNKQTSSKACALSLVRQMFHLGVIEPFGGPVKKAKTDQNPLYKVTVSPDIKKNLSDVIKNLGLQPKQKTESDNGDEINMVVNYTIVDFEPQSHHRPQVIPWAPAMPNWNAWLASNIDEGEQAFLSLDEISKQLKDNFMHQRSSNMELQCILKERESLPAAAYEEDIVNAVINNQIVIIRGETGSGKTTQIPQFLMDYHIQCNKGAECNIIVTQPRRISAITLAERVAQERAESLGQSCGYSVRFETIYPQPYGALLYCTVGTLLRKMESGLRGISHLIVDEIHERDLNTDFLMILLKDMVVAYPQLKIILMSATIDINLFKNYFPNIFVVEIEGRSFPVNCYFLEDCIEMLKFQPEQCIKKDKKPNVIDITNEEHMGFSVHKFDDIEVNCNNICDDTYKPETRNVMSKLSEKEINFEIIEALLKYIENIHPDGAILIFLPGWNIIQMLLKHLSKHVIYGSSRYLLLPLHSQVSRVDQKKVFQTCRQGIRKIILATNIAESSITINDVMFVIDSCRAKVKMFTSRNNLTSYNTVWASKTNLEQRRGRAGRVCEGYAFHLCSRARFERLETHQTPEILRTALHDLALMIKLLKLGDTKQFLSKAIEQPPIDAIIEAEHLLKEMKAFDKNDELTPLGQILARLPIEPRMGKMLIFGCFFGVGDACTIIAACSSLGDPLVIPHERKRLSKAQIDLSGDRYSDHVATLNAFQKWNSVQMRGLSEEEFCESKGLNLSILKMSKEAASQMKSILINTGFPEDCLAPQFFDYNSSCSMLNTIITLLVLGLYPNVCFHKEKRKVVTTESKPALVHKSSVNCNNYITSFPSPFFIFGEKIRTRAVSCKQMSMINPLQLLIFGSRKVTYQNKLIIIDDWLMLDMEFELAANILALQPALEGLMVKVCMNPDIIMNPDESDKQLLDIVTQLSVPDLCCYGLNNANFKKSIDLNRKRKAPWNYSRPGYNTHNRGIPNKTRIIEKNIPYADNETHRVASKSPFESVIQGRHDNFSRSSSIQRSSSFNKLPFINQPNSSFIRNKFTAPIKSDYNEYYNDNNSSYNMSNQLNSPQMSYINKRSPYLLRSPSMSSFVSGNSSFYESLSDFESPNFNRQFSQPERRLFPNVPPTPPVNYPGYPIHPVFKRFPSNESNKAPVIKTYEKHQYKRVNQYKSQEQILNNSNRSTTAARSHYDKVPDTSVINQYESQEQMLNRSNRGSTTNRSQYNSSNYVRQSGSNYQHGGAFNDSDFDTTKEMSQYNSNGRENQTNFDNPIDQYDPINECDPDNSNENSTQNISQYGLPNNSNDNVRGLPCFLRRSQNFRGRRR